VRDSKACCVHTRSTVPVSVPPPVGNCGTHPPVLQTQIAWGTRTERVTELSELVNPALRLQKRQSGTRSLPLHYQSHTSAYFIISNILLAKQEPFYIELLGFWTSHIIYRSDTQSFGACSMIEKLAILLWHSTIRTEE